MRKLYRLKKWYSIDDACDRFLLTLGEYIPIREIYQLIADGHIAVYWNVSRKPAREVCPATMIYASGDPVFDTLKESGKIAEDCRMICMEGLEPQDEVIQNIDGLFKIDTERVGAAKEWLKAIAAGRECDYISLDGTLLIGEDGRYWQLMAPFSATDGTRRYAPGVAHNHIDNFYPTFELPEPDEIVISKGEIERFEAQFSEPAELIVEKPFTTNERNTLLVLIAALCKKAGIDPAARGAAGELVQLARSDGINVDIDPDTVRGKLKQIPDALGARAK